MGVFDEMHQLLCSPLRFSISVPSSKMVLLPRAELLLLIVWYHRSVMSSYVSSDEADHLQTLGAIDRGVKSL